MAVGVLLVAGQFPFASEQHGRGGRSAEWRVGLPLSLCRIWLLDVWHGVATLALLPSFLVGVARARMEICRPRGPGTILSPAVRPPWRSRYGLGRTCLLAASVGATGAGFVIMGVGVSAVFVPQDLEFLGVSVPELHALNPRLVPLIAHDRAGFGGALVASECKLCACGADGHRDRSGRRLALAGVAGSARRAPPRRPPTRFIWPPRRRGGLFASGLALTYGPMHSRSFDGNPGSAVG